NENIVVVTFGVLVGRTGNVVGRLGTVRGEKVDSRLTRYGFKLVNGGRSIDVRTDHEHLFLAALATALLVMAIGQPFGELAGGGSFTGTLQAGHENDGRGLRGQ